MEWSLRHGGTQRLGVGYIWVLRHRLFSSLSPPPTPPSAQQIISVVQIILHELRVLVFCTTVDSGSDHQCIRFRPDGLPDDEKTMILPKRYWFDHISQPHPNSRPGSRKPSGKRRTKMVHEAMTTFTPSCARRYSGRCKAFRRLATTIIFLVTFSSGHSTVFENVRL